ncbi:O-antigen ligase family protein [Acanthopleuribacter pedis]|uniref:O-antigen ligase family protein n=1 Tax=Acanthopleuribacter pedis TaxID=442870 RepID=A0A8J7U0W0_9BACT|nr:O-antigen ligase family protein [Acanthopleuribacter pedis]MBO1316922.1 O-antigen ligase family protein [Acanthopleuribacter pedis]
MTQSLNQKLIPWMLTFYLGIAPIYWLPAVPMQALFVLKLGLVALSVVLVFMQSLVIRGNIMFPKGLAGPMGWILLVVTAAPGFFQATPAAGFTRFYDSILIFVFSWTFYNLTHNGVNVLKIFWHAGLMITGFASLTLLHALTGLPSWQAPVPSLEPLTLSRVGFHMLSSGWACGIVLFLPLLLAILYAYHAHRFIRSSTTTAAAGVGLFFILFASMFVVSGRTGLLAATVVAMFIALKMVSRTVGLMLSGGIGLAAYQSWERYFNHLRFDRLRSSEMDDISRFSSGRVDGYLEGVRLIMERPFTGHGFDTLDMREYGIIAKDIHNLWLKMAGDAGIFYPIAFSCILATYALKFKRILDLTPEPNARRFYTTFGLIIPCGLIVASLSPTGIFGSFQNNAVFWAAIGYLLAKVDIKEAEAATRRTQTETSTTPEAEKTPNAPQTPITRSPA